MKDNNVIYRAMSFTDLESMGIQVKLAEIDGVQTVIGISKSGKDYGTLKSLLWQCGIVNNFFFEVTPKTKHVRVNGEQTYNHRFVGQERFDNAWLNSGHASDEAQLGNCKMKDMVAHAGKLRNGGDR